MYLLKLACISEFRLYFRSVYVSLTFVCVSHPFLCISPLHVSDWPYHCSLVRVCYRVLYKCPLSLRVVWEFKHLPLSKIWHLSMSNLIVSELWIRVSLSPHVRENALTSPSEPWIRIKDKLLVYWTQISFFKSLCQSILDQYIFWWFINKASQLF